jgi:hypothetical protein
MITNYSEHLCCSTHFVLSHSGARAIGFTCIPGDYMTHYPVMVFLAGRIELNTVSCPFLAQFVPVV